MAKLKMRIFVRVLIFSLLATSVGCSRSDDVAGGDDTSGLTPGELAEEGQAELESVVSKMAAIGWATGASFAPDGERVAYISSETGAPQVWIGDLSRGESRQATFFDDQVNGVQWSPTSEILAVSVAPGGGLNTQLYLVAPTGEEPQQITAGGTVNNWLGIWSDDGRYLAYSSNALGSGSMDSFLYDTEENEAALIAENDGIGVVAALSPNAERAIIWRMRSRGNTDLYLLDVVSGRERLLTPHDGVAESDLALFADDHTIFISTNIDREMVSVGRIDIDEQGEPGAIRIVAEREDAVLQDFAIADEGAQIALLWNASGRSEIAFFEIESGNMVAGPPLPAEIASGITATVAGNRIALTISGAATPQNVWQYDVDSKTFSQVSASAHDGIELEALVKPTLVRYPAHDGIELSGWLYLPEGVTGPVPMVTSFHGGPEGQERPRFRSVYQALLTRGIGVFAPNVRGSSGFGKTFVNLDNGALRFDGIKDIQSTVNYLVDSGLANPDRIGIMGGSYGGYMVMAGLVNYPDMFAAGANLFGVVNFETFFANTEPWMAAISTIEYGDPETEAELLVSLSPIHQVDNVVAPTIVLHGANDTNVPVVEAEQVVESLESRGVPVKYVLFPDEGHGWRKTKNRVTSDVEIVQWFDTHL